LDATHLAYFLRALATTPSRRAMARALAGCGLAGALHSLFGLTEVDAKRRKHRRKRRRKKHKDTTVCAGKNYCTDTSLCSASGVSPRCFCMVTVETGQPFCSLEPRLAACAECTAEETCVDGSGFFCGNTIGCGLPCPYPL